MKRKFKVETKESEIEIEQSPEDYPTILVDGKRESVYGACDGCRCYIKGQLLGLGDVSYCEECVKLVFQTVLNGAKQ